MKTTLWMTIRTKGTLEGGEVLMWQTRDLQGLPLVGEEIVLWPFEPDGDPDDGPMLQVNNRLWDANGQVHLQLGPLVLDPTDNVRVTCGPHASAWYSSYQGDPVQAALRNHWVGA
jgi:hypothetical protein